MKNTNKNKFPKFTASYSIKDVPLGNSYSGNQANSKNEASLIIQQGFKEAYCALGATAACLGHPACFKHVFEYCAADDW